MTSVTGKDPVSKQANKVNGVERKRASERPMERRSKQGETTQRRPVREEDSERKKDAPDQYSRGEAGSGFQCLMGRLGRSA